MRPQQNRSFANLLMIMAGVIFVAAVVAVALPPRLMAAVPHLSEWIALATVIAASMALLALAVLIRREATAPPEVSAALSRLQQQMMDVQQRLNDLHTMSDRAAARAHQPAGQAGASAAAGKDYTHQFQQLAAAINEVHEVSLLPDAERRQRIQLHRQQRKATFIKEIFGLVAAHDWPRAERLLITLETENPNDEEVAKGRSYLNHSRKLFEEESIQAGVRDVESLMAAASWDRAWDRARELVAGFPENGDARAILTRVERERNTFHETTVGRMFEEIRHDIDRRIWRRALMHSDRLLQQFPTHRLADKIREQLKTLQDNAEIEERQELEVRIQELIRAGHFEQAIELAEDVIRRYPMSPQAESLETLLPRIRELARQGPAEFSGLSPDVELPEPGVLPEEAGIGPEDPGILPDEPATADNPFRTDGPIQQPTSGASE
jgi:hypothetical protein